MAKSRYSYKAELLEGRGFLPFEAREFARQYSVAQMRSLPYFVGMRRWRSLYTANLRSRGYSDEAIREAIMRLYKRLEWRSPWDMLKRFRGKSIADNEYIPPSRGGSHHKGGISKGDLKAQRQRRKQRLSSLERYDVGRGR